MRRPARPQANLPSPTAPRRLHDAQIAAYVAGRVRDARVSQAITQAELARALGVKRESLSRYESGERAISIALLLDIAAALEQPLDAFLPPQHPHQRPAAPPPDAGLAHVTAVLQQHPHLIPTVQDLLEAMREDD